MFNKILVPLDGSVAAERALDPALSLARLVEGEVLLVHSLVPVQKNMPDCGWEYAWLWPEEMLELPQSQAETYLAALGKRFTQPGVTVQPLLLEGDEAGVVLDTAEDERADLIVMSAYGSSATAGWSMGSITERVLHNAPCPVLVVHSSRPIQRILIALDGSSLSELCLRPGFEIARLLDASVTLLHVCPPVERRQAALVYDTMVAGSADTLVRDERAAAEDYLSKIARTYAPESCSGCAITTEVAEGVVAEQILAYTAVHECDLIVMTTHGRTGLKRWIYGSNAAKVVRNARTNLLIVRPARERLRD
jgi:nucleotide-binding universal stress UspA family protein